jgi:hypothetical protein
MDPRTAASLLTTTIPSQPHKVHGVLVVHTDAPHRLHSTSSPHEQLPVVWPLVGAAVPQADLLAACGTK